MRDDPEPWFGRDDTSRGDRAAAAEPDGARKSAGDSDFDARWGPLGREDRTHPRDDVHLDADEDGDERGDGFDGDEPAGWWGAWRRRLILAGAGLVVILLATLLVGRWLGETPPPTPDQLPLIEAEGTPAKVHPADRGGVEVPHQDRLIYDRLAGEAEATQPKVERLLPPPEDPLPKPLAMPTLPRPPVAAEPPPVAELPAKPPLAHLVDGTGATGSPDDTSEATGRRSTVVTVRPPPERRPDAGSGRDGGALAGAAAAAPATAFVQVGALRSEQAAMTEWRRLQRLHGDLLTGLEPSFRRADLGERGVFHRVLGGPVTAARAENICASLKERGVGCYVIDR